MLRFLALLVVMAASLLMQGEPAVAHENRFTQLPAISEGQAEGAFLERSSIDVDGCSSELGCCMASCAPCKLPLPEHIGATAMSPFASSAVRVSPDDIYRSNVPNHEPPVPKPHLL